MIEIAFALPIILVALGMFLQMLSAGAGLRDMGRESWAASTAAQEVLEEIRNEEFRSIFLLYNADPFDDPTGPGTSPGNTFDVPGLEEAVGEVVFPFVNTGTEVVPVWEVREDVDMAELGMPRDLNGDILVDGEDHADDYSLLPVLVRLRWRGEHGPRELRLQTVFSELR